MAISRKIQESMTKASWIRRMFEEGVRLRKEHGADNVFDFSLGNPILEPPPQVGDVLRAWAIEPRPGSHRYMPNNGYPEVREVVANHTATRTGTPVVADDVVMTVGAAGALNAALKSLLDEGDEVIVVAPYFPEYAFYVDNHGGKLVVVESTESFELDPEAFERALTPRTKAIILNSPNNPTGVVYGRDGLAAVAQVVADHESRTGTVVTLLSDEPYRKIVYDGIEVPDILSVHPNSVFITSHSKDLGLAGERIGYAIVSPHHADRAALIGALTFTNRTLGYVNAPALFQRVAAEAIDASVPIDVYTELRELLCSGLTKAGFEFVQPQGAFYVFPKAPIDDIEFINVLQKHRILAVPGSGFGRPGYVRMSYCVTRGEIERALPLFEQVMSELKA